MKISNCSWAPDMARTIGDTTRRRKSAKLVNFWRAARLDGDVARNAAMKQKFRLRGPRRHKQRADKLQRNKVKEAVQRADRGSYVHSGSFLEAIRPGDQPINP
ncbi:gustatory receptor for sugar taste 64e-like [Drosophila grimshawi]|uniref:gustatory receptor for sugar taste 64e-like n=1 Tax=Drosophila grimshawi TaxID=7222 RepID=UPI001C936C9B|nr:gustatory receptor for sugar taste 64e-like [Drosophila grimshawi]